MLACQGASSRKVHMRFHRMALFTPTYFSPPATPSSLSFFQTWPDLLF